MSNRASPVLIGAFVICALILAIAAAIVLGSGVFLTDTDTYVLYFSGSVKGLNPGAPVIFRGVRIGSVSRIRAEYDPADDSIRIPVDISVEGSQLLQPGGERMAARQRVQLMGRLVERGLRAQLQLQSVVTGQLVVALDFHPEKPLNLVGAQSEYPELPTVPSTMEELSQTFENLPLEELIRSARQVIGEIERLVTSQEAKDLFAGLNKMTEAVHELAQSMNEDLPALAADLQQATADIRETLRMLNESIARLDPRVDKTLDAVEKLAQRVDAQIDPVAANIMQAAEAARASLERAGRALAAAEGLASEQSELRHELTQALKELAAAARSVRAVADYLERHPEALLHGKGGE